MKSLRHKGWIHRGGVKMVKANRKTLIFNPLSLAFILFRQAYVKIQDLASKFLTCLKNTVIHKISMRLNCDAFVRFLKNVKIQDLTPIMKLSSVSLIIIVLITAFVALKPSFAAAGEVSIQGIPTAELFGAIDVKDSELVGTDAFKARISSNETYVEFKNQGKSYWIKSVPVGFRKVRGRTQREIITFEGVMAGVTLKEKLYEGKTKEEIWLLSRESPTSFMFVLSHSDNLILKKDGEDILLSEINSNKEIGRIESPFAVDAKGTRYRYTYTLKGNTLVLEPVSSLDGAIYPLVIDPSYTIIATATDSNVTAYTSQRKLARSANGDLHAVYHRLVTVNNVYYAKSTDGGQTWTETALTSETVYAQYNPAIAVDSKNYLHVVWQGTDSSWPTTQLKYQKYTTSWQPVQYLTSENYTQNMPSIAVDSNDNLHVTWYGLYSDSPTNYQIRYIKYDNALGAWQTIQNLTSDPPYLQYSPSIAVDSNNNLHIVWYGKYDGSITYQQIRYIKYDNALGAWQTIQNLTNEGYSQQRSQIAIDSYDNLHVAWSGQHNGSANGMSYLQIRYIKYDNALGAWQTITNLTDEGYTQQWSSIAVDSHNYIHIVWFGFISASVPQYYQIRYIEYTTSWQPIQNLTAATISQRHPNTFWARWPRISGVLTNRPHDGYAFFWMDGYTVKYYCSSDLSWDIAGGLLSYGSTTPGELGQKYQTWGIGNIPQWGGENSGPVSSVTTNWTVLKASPANPGVYVMAMVTTEASNNFKVYSYYNGTWTSEFTATQSSTQDNYRLFDVAFENSSGNVLVVYGKTGSNTVYYREGTWNGSNFGLSGASEGSFTFNTSYLSGNTRWLILSNRLNSDQMILLTVSDQTGSGNNISAAIWDGSSFGNQNSTGWGLVYTNTNWDFDCAYETSSGDGMVAWGVSGSPYWKYATYSGGTWTVNNGTAGDITGPIRVLALDGNPSLTSDYIVAGLLEDTNSDDINGAVWNGSSWVQNANVDAAVFDTTPTGREVDVKYAGTSGNAILVYNDTTDLTLDWARSVGGAAFALGTDLVISGGYDNNIQLVSDASGSNKVMLVRLDSNSGLYAYYYTVASNTWTATNSGIALETNSSGGTSNESYMFAYESVFPTVVTLISFTARGKGNYVKVEWETKTEIDNLGFNLYRSTERNGTYIKLNSTLIPGLLSSVTGRKYSHTDADVIKGTLYYYKLEDIDLNVKVTVHGPICVDWDADGIPDDEDSDIALSDTDSEESSSGSGGDLTGYKGGIVTRVELQWLRAHRTKDGIKVEWQTGYEVDNLGFHVYREEGGELYRLTPELIAGSALLAGSGTALTAGHSYQWWDLNPQSTVTPTPTLPPRGGGIGWGVRYWLEDIDLNGKRTMHGPVTPVLSQGPLPEKVKTKFLSELGVRLEEKYRDYWKAQELRERLGQRSMKRTTSSQSFEQTSKAFEQPKELKETTSIKIEKTSEQDGEKQRSLASRQAIKISVKEEGWYRVSQPELVAAGLNPGTNPRYLQLFVDGKEQPISVTGEKDGKFDPQDAIEFYGVGLDTPSTDTRVYWLVAESRRGKRTQVYKGRGGQLADESFPYTAEKKDRTIYFPALKNGEDDNFFGPVVAAEPVDQLMSVLHLSQAPPGEAMLEVALQGATNVPHRIKVLLNETEVGEVVFDGQSPGTAGFTIPQALLLEGDNLVSLIAQGGEMDVSVVDYIRLTYWHTYTADDDALKFTAQGGKQLSINGFSNPKIRVIDITNPGALLEVAGKVNPQGIGYSVTFKVPGSRQRTLLALTEEKVKKPAGIAANQPSSWYQSKNGYDFVIIAHRDYLESIQPLKNLRGSQGLSVALIDVEDLYDEFNFGAKNPRALLDFLSLKKQWSKPPRFLLLVGDASFDPRNYLGFGDFDFVPTKLIDTAYLETASDDWFVDFNGDGLPEMAVGRLPVRTDEEANTVISKIIGYEQSTPNLEALLVADINDGFNFEAASEEVGVLLQPHVSIREIFRGNFSSDAEAKAELLSSIDQGPLLVNYIGHGSVEIWRGSIFTSDDADSFINGMRLPFVVSMTCLNGFFHDLYTESLAEALLKAKQGGAMAVWASSGLTEPGGQVVMNKELVRILFDGESLTIGEATAKAKASVGDQDIRRTWILFGDPATRLK